MRGCDPRQPAGDFQLSKKQVQEAIVDTAMGDYANVTQSIITKMMWDLLSHVLKPHPATIDKLVNGIMAQAKDSVEETFAGETLDPLTKRALAIAFKRTSENTGLFFTTPILGKEFMNAALKRISKTLKKTAKEQKSKFEVEVELEDEE